MTMMLGESIYNSSHCPVCNNNYEDSLLTLAFNRPQSPRQKIVMKILIEINMKGSFQVSSVKEFWKRFYDELCFSCREELNLMGTHQARALVLLKEAVKLDPDNEIARENLKKVKQMI